MGNKWYLLLVLEGKKYNTKWLKVGIFLQRSGCDCIDFVLHNDFHFIWFHIYPIICCYLLFLSTQLTQVINLAVQTGTKGHVCCDDTVKCDKYT